MKIIAKTSLLILIAFCLATGISAATFVVNTADDTSDALAGNGSCADSNSNCSLRAAISEANALAGPDIITLGAVAYTQSLAASEENNNAGGDWDIKSDLTINGADEATTILQAIGCALNRDRVLDVTGSITVTLNNLTIRNGCLSTVAPGAGGGILNTGNLTLNKVTVRDNKVQNFEGGAGGGGIFNWGGSLALNNSTVTNNRVSGSIFGSTSGGGINSLSLNPVIITGSSITQNVADGFNQPAFGGGMYVSNFAGLTITDSHFDNNTVQGSGTDNGGGGLYVLSNTGLPPDDVNITRSTFNNNTATGNNASGAGLYLLTGTDSNSRLFVTIDQTTVNGNSAPGGGAGIQVLPTLGWMKIDVKNSTISNNISGSRGGGVSLGTTGNGADILAYFTNTTMSGNSATEGGALSGRALSGGISAQFNYCTLTDNTASVRGGAIADSVNGLGLYLWRTVVSGNTAPNGNDIAFSGSVASLDYNHIGDMTNLLVHGNTTHNTTGNAMLGALADNGGPTLTHLPDAGSPLVDAIPVGQYTCGTIFDPPTFGDQRGFGRPFGSGCDKGSVERGATLAAGPWTLSGTVKTTTGIPIRNVAVTISGGNLPAPVTVFTGNFGTYQFTNLSGNEYTVTVTAKRYHFNDSIVVFQLGSNITNADFVANAPFNREVMRSAPGTKK